MKSPDYRQFQVNTPGLLHRLETSGRYVVSSEIGPSVGYLIESGTIGIIAGKNGMLSVDIDRLPVLISELMDIYELAKYRQEAKIKGA